MSIMATSRCDTAKLRGGFHGFPLRRQLSLGFENITKIVIGERLNGKWRHRRQLENEQEAYIYRYFPPRTFSRLVS